MTNEYTKEQLDWSSYRNTLLEYVAIHHPEIKNQFDQDFKKEKIDREKAYDFMEQRGKNYEWKHLEKLYDVKYMNVKDVQYYWIYVKNKYIITEYNELLNQKIKERDQWREREYTNS